MLFVRSPLMNLPTISTGLFELGRLSSPIPSVVGVCSAIDLFALFFDREHIYDPKKEDGSLSTLELENELAPASSSTQDPSSASPSRRPAPEEREATQIVVEGTQASSGECGSELWKELGFNGKSA